MRAWILATALALACSGPDSGPTEATDATDDTDVGIRCEYAAFAGQWAGVGSTPDLEGINIDATIEASVAEGERVILGSAHTTHLDPNFICEFEALCLGRTQNDWHVVQDRILSGTCTPGYSFYRLEDDSTLSMEGSDSEFGTRDGARASLERVE